MSNNKQSSVIHIRNWVRTNGDMSEDGKSITYSCKELEAIIAEAKAMHKEEIVDASIDGMYKGQDIYFSEGKVKLDVNSLNYCIGTADEYYNETYGGNK